MYYNKWISLGCIRWNIPHQKHILVPCGKHPPLLQLCLKTNKTPEGEGSVGTWNVLIFFPKISLIGLNLQDGQFFIFKAIYLFEDQSYSKREFFHSLLYSPRQLQYPGLGQAKARNLELLLSAMQVGSRHLGQFLLRFTGQWQEAGLEIERWLHWSRCSYRVMMSQLVALLAMPPCGVLIHHPMN